MLKPLDIIIGGVGGQGTILAGLPNLTRRIAKRPKTPPAKIIKFL
jgi:Pyruvate/2-oxoacid:ferredoxin oxidoreductase gamma subunit